MSLVTYSYKKFPPKYILLVIYIVIKFILLILLLNPSAHSKEKVRVAYSEIVSNFAPQLVEMITQMYKNINVETVSQILPSSRALGHFENGKADALGVRIKGYELINPDAIAIPISILDKSSTRAWVLKSKLAKVRKLKNVTYLSMSGDISARVYELNSKVKSASRVTSLKNAIKMLKRERADALIVSDGVLLVAGLNEIFSPLNDLVVSNSLHHFIHSSKKHLMPALEKEFKKAKDNGLFNGPPIKLKK